MIFHQCLTIFPFEAYDQTYDQSFIPQKTYITVVRTIQQLYTTRKKITYIEIDSKINFNQQKVWLTKLFLTQILLFHFNS